MVLRQGMTDVAWTESDRVTGCRFSAQGKVLKAVIPPLLAVFTRS